MSLFYLTIFFYFNVLFVFVGFCFGLVEISLAGPICTMLLFCFIISIGCLVVQIVRACSVVLMGSFFACFGVAWWVSVVG